MSDYPSNKISRQKRRAAILRAELAAAHARAVATGRSIKCGQLGNHAPDGCQNDGSNCLCECHDPVGSSEVTDGR
jgi:hypothetical protein